MRLEGIHHVTAITGDAPGNVDFYARVLGLRLVKKTVNQDDPTVYHLFYADEKGSAGSDLTFFEYPGAPPGRAGAGMVHTVVWRVGPRTRRSSFWAERMAGEGVRDRARRTAACASRTRRASPTSWLVDQSGDDPLIADHPEVPAEHGAARLRRRARLLAPTPTPARALLEDRSASTRDGDAWEARGERRGGRYLYEPRPSSPGCQSAGTVHHVAWASTMDEHEAWREQVMEAGGRPTPVIDRFYFRSIYFREPSGVLFEIATLGPGFATDEDPEHLGERLSLPPNFEHVSRSGRAHAHADREPARRFPR